jgi:predicted dehydrogenase
MADAQKMIEAGQKAGRILMVGHLLHYHSAFLALKKLDLGPLRHIHSSRMNFGKIRTEENVFWSFAPHDVSMMLGLAGREPVSVKASYMADLPESTLASTAVTSFDFGGGLSGHISVSWLNPFKEQKLTVVGAKGMAVFDDTLPWDKKLAFYKNSVAFKDGQPVLSKGEVEYIAAPESAPLREECRHFAECIATGATPRTDGAEAARVLKVMQACDRAAEAS